VLLDNITMVKLLNIYSVDSLSHVIIFLTSFSIFIIFLFFNLSIGIFYHVVYSYCILDIQYMTTII
jgi:hypothetical protein